MKFEVTDNTQLLTATSKKSMATYGIPLSNALKYAQLTHAAQIRQSVLPLEFVARLLREKVVLREDILNFIPHATWLLIKTRGVDQKFQPKKVIELMKEYLEHI